MKKIISFSLWGDDPKYCVGAIRNAELAREIYPDWVCRFYIGMSVPKNTIISLVQVDNNRLELPTKVSNHNGYILHRAWNERIEVVKMSEVGDWKGMFWRFEPASDPDIDIMISRDCDSRLSLREATAVGEWLNSDKGFHIMRDHPWHGSQILGGMLGVKKNILPDMVNLMQQWNQEDRWQTDQDFLNSEIYPRVVNDSMIHAQFFSMESHAIPFPKLRSNLEFVGQVFDENENTVAEHQKVLRQALKGRGEPIRHEHLPEFPQ